MQISSTQLSEISNPPRITGNGGAVAGWQIKIDDGTYMYCTAAEATQLACEWATIAQQLLALETAP